MMQTAGSLLTTRRLLTGLLLVCLLISGCGFKMRGQAPLPFDTLYTNVTRNSAFGIQIYRLLKASSPNTTMVDEPGLAQVRLIQQSFSRTRSEVSLDFEGKVEEYELGLVFIFTITDAKGNILAPSTRLSATRLMPYSEDDAAAKSAEMQLLYRDMEKSIADRLYRRVISEGVIERYKQFNP